MPSTTPPWQRQVLRLEPTVMALWFLAPAALWVLDYARNRDNTFKIYRHVFWHLLERRNLYLPSPAEYGDVNLYGPAFALVVAPFAILPEALGGLLWNLAMAGVLYLASGRLGLARERRVLLLLVCLVELLNAAWSNQLNPAIAAVMLLTFAGVEERRDFLAPLWILLGAFVKLYSAVGLLFLLFARRRKAFLAGCAAWSILLLVAPMALSSPAYVLSAYQDWFVALVEKNSHNVALFTSQDISIPGVIRRVVGAPLPGPWFLLAGAALALAPLLRVGQHRHRVFRILVLASLLMFVVLFSSGSESSSYVICATGAGLWLVHQERPLRPRNLALLAALLLAGLAPTDLLTAPVRLATNRYALKALPYAITWLLLCRDLLTRDFGRDPAFQEAAVAAAPSGAAGLQLDAGVSSGGPRA